MVEQNHRMYDALEVFPTDEQGKITGGSVGFYYKLDACSHETIGLGIGLLSGMCTG